MSDTLETGSMDTGQFIVGCVFTGLFCVFGVVVNICVYLVVLQIKVLCRYMWFLLSLTFYDWMICLFAIFHLVFPAFCAYFQPTQIISFLNSQPYIKTIDGYVFSVLQCAEIWITVALTYDRFWLISQPIESGSLFDKRRTKKTIVVVSILAILYNIPKAIFLSHHQEGVSHGHDNNTIHLPSNNTELLHWESSEVICTRIENQTTAEWVYCLMYDIILNWTLLHILPILALVFYNIKLFHKVQVAKRHLCRVSTLKTGSKDSFWATVNIIALVIFFIVCQTPSFIFKICAFTGVATYTGLAHQITQLILIINSACNFVVYFLIFGLFRRLAMSFFCGVKIEKEPSDQVSRTCSSNTFTRRSRPIQAKYLQQISKDGSFYSKTVKAVP